MKKQRGFSLLELLVIVGIIVIISTIILVNLSQSKGKASDTAVVKNLNDLQTYANLYYLDKGANYSGFCSDDQSLIFLSNAGTENNRTCNESSDGSNWCAYAELKNGNNLSYCVDATVTRKKLDTESVMDSCTNYYVCPN